MMKLIETWNAKRQVAAELSCLSDRTLDDIGISRSDIAAVAGLAAESQRPAKGKAGS